MIKFYPLDSKRRPKPIEYKIPPKTKKIVGELNYPTTISDLDQDIICFELDDGTYLDLGWYPSYDANGYYSLIHFSSGNFDDGITIIQTQDIEKIAQAISLFGV